jgi:predicted nucleotidyltransferase
MARQTLIEKIPLVLDKYPDIGLVYLFGSQVSGDLGPMSDYDPAIFDLTHDAGYETQLQFQHDLAKLLNTDRVDVVLLNCAPVELAYHIISEGKILYERDTYSSREKYGAGYTARTYPKAGNWPDY